MNLLHKLWPLLFPSWLMLFSCHMPIVEGLFFPWCVHVILINIKATYKYSFGKDRTQSASKCLWQGCPDCQVLQATIQHVHLAESLSLPSDSLSHPESHCLNTDVPWDTDTIPHNNLNPSLPPPNSHISKQPGPSHLAAASPPSLQCVPAGPAWSSSSTNRWQAVPGGSSSSSSTCNATSCSLPAHATWHRHVLQSAGSLHIMELPQLERDKPHPSCIQQPSMNKVAFLPATHISYPLVWPAVLPRSGTSGVRKWEHTRSNGNPNCVWITHTVLWSPVKVPVREVISESEELLTLWETLSASRPDDMIPMLGTGKEFGCLQFILFPDPLAALVLPQKVWDKTESPADWWDW